MGLLDFARAVGRRLFRNDAEAAENIKQHLETELTGIRNVRVDCSDGVVTLSGECDSQNVRDHAIHLAGSVKSVETVIADDLTAPEPEPEAEESPNVTIHEIQSGDTLVSIAVEYYGKASQYVRIIEANADILASPGGFYPGRKLRIPLDPEVQ